MRFCPLASVLFCLFLSACLPSPIPPPPSLPVTQSPAHPATLPPSPTATWSPSPSVPTLAPAAVSATIAAGEARLAAASVEPLCLRREDADDDGEAEWVGLYLRPTDPPQLLGFILDGHAWYDLKPPEGAEGGLGEYSACEFEVRDLNGDGRTEIAIWGHVGIGTDLLHIFAWDRSRYALLGAFEGAAGIRMEDADGDLIEEVVVRLPPEGEALVREIVYTWDGAHYAWTWDRYAWFYLDRPHAYVGDSPLHTLASFYLALDDRDLPGAYGLLSPAAQSARPYDEWALGFTTTLAVEVGAAQVAAQEGGWATVSAQVRALDNVYGRVIVTLYDVEWQLVWTEVGWRLESGTSQVLDQWELSYYP